ncbi:MULTISPECIES: ABC transporter ATP-binding protein [Paraburkholderia]|uniref:ABC transporter ATP-binding protein n=1 Tax=Paraburkholderia TaxID=1822464 RepID=UPI0034633C36
MTVVQLHDRYWRLARVFSAPRHPYTQTLMAAAPRLDFSASQESRHRDCWNSRQIPRTSNHLANFCAIIYAVAFRKTGASRRSLK